MYSCSLCYFDVQLNNKLDLFQWRFLLIYFSIVQTDFDEVLIEQQFFWVVCEFQTYKDNIQKYCKNTKKENFMKNKLVLKKTTLIAHLFDSPCIQIMPVYRLCSLILTYLVCQSVLVFVCLFGPISLLPRRSNLYFYLDKMLTVTFFENPSVPTDYPQVR